MSEKICGLDYITSTPQLDPNGLKNARTAKFRKKPQGRILVEGCHKVDGTHIRFKSLKRAENHIKNMGLGKSA